MSDPANPAVMNNATCFGCGAEVRPGSEFCYNCGGKLGNAAGDPASSKEPRKVIKENGAIQNGPGGRIQQKVGRRRQARSPRPQPNEPVQVVWKRDEGVGTGFLLLSVGTALFVILLILIAYYLK